METENKEKGKWLSNRGAIVLCQEYAGRKITKVGLIHIGRELGFIRRHSDGFHWEYERAGLLKYLRTPPAPEGWISMSDFARLVDVDINMVYYILRKYELKTKMCGKVRKVRGVIHVREKDALTAYAKYKGVNNDGKKKIESIV